MSDADVKFGPSGQVIYERTYSRTKPDGSKENWPETVERVVGGNLALVEERFHQKGERDDLIRMMTGFKILPGGRHLWASGVRNAQHLFNPVVGSSEVTTRDGVRKINELTGQTVDVLAMSDRCDMATRQWESVGAWRPAKFIYSGEQPTYRVLFESGREVVSTAEHNWFSIRSRRKLTTLDLVGERIPVMAQPRPEENIDYMHGALRGIIFGDGTVDTTSSKIHIYADEDEELIDLFRKAGHKYHYSETRKFWYVGRLPLEWKLEIPSVDESASFWRGFFAGWLAADGHVTKKGTVMIHNRDRDVFERTRAGLEKAGIHFVNEPVLCRSESPFDGSESTLYRQSFKRYSLTDRDFIQRKKRDRFGSTLVKGRTTTDRVVSVTPTGLREPVYCCLEPATHSWTVNGVLTGNCWVSGWTEKPSEHFQFTFMRLMEGGGVGANYSNRYLADYPPVQQDLLVDIVCDPEHPDYASMVEAGVISNEYHPDWAGCFQIEDSREGWAAALVDLIDTHYRDEVKNFHRVYDVSRVRHAGAKLQTFGGKASGPLPLAQMLIGVNEILAEKAYYHQPLTGMAAMEIDHAIAQCVVAGGVRRSARMAMMHWTDPQIGEFIKCKSETGSHWTTNISVEVDQEFWNFANGSAVAAEGHPWQGEYMEDTARGILRLLAEGAVRNGEPGMWDSSLSNVGEPNRVVCTNPCGEITLEPWEPCNLGHVNLAAFVHPNGTVDWSALHRAHRLMTRFLIRATFSPVADPKSGEVLARNRRIGVGHLGVASYLALTGSKYSEARSNEEFRADLREWAALVDQAAADYAHQLRIPVPVKKRTVAPTGTIAKMPGVSEGIHPIFSKYFIRRIRFNRVSDFESLLDLVAQGYEIEDDLYAPNTAVASIPTKDSLLESVEAIWGSERAAEIVESADDLTLNQLLGFQALYQQLWADNAVSFTANVDPDRYTEDHVSAQLRTFAGQIKGSTIFPEASIPQAPYERITREQYEAATAKAVADGVDENCASGSACPIR